MDRLRLAVALPHLGVYGGVRRFLELGRVWTERGHDVTIATPGGEQGSAGRRIEDRAEVAWLPFPGRLATIDEMARERWDAVLSPDPVLFRDLHPNGALRVFYAVLEKAPGAEEAWRSADLVLANSAGMARPPRRPGGAPVPPRRRRELPAVPPAPPAPAPPP